MSEPGFDVDVVRARAAKPGFAWAGLIVIVAFLTFGAASSAAATLGVATTGTDAGNCVVTPCSTIEYAVGQAAPGDTIEVGPGTFGAATGNATVTIDRANLTIVGVDAESTVVEAPEGTTGAAAFEIEEAGDGLKLEGMKITSPYATATERDLRGVRTAPGPVTVSGLTLDGVEISGFRYGFETPSVAIGQQASLTGMTISQSLGGFNWSSQHRFM